MDVLIDNRGVLLDAFSVTARLFLFSALLALVLGTVLATLRVCPVPVARFAGTSYISVVRNTPLLLVFILVTAITPVLGFHPSFFILAIVSLTTYTSAFICEAIRSGINAVEPGQAEAARSLGLTFRQNLTVVVLPQAARTTIQPVASVLIALVRNTAVASTFGVLDLSFELAQLLHNEPGSLYVIFLGIAACYMSIVAVVATIAKILERRLVVLR